MPKSVNPGWGLSAFCWVEIPTEVEPGSPKREYEQSYFEHLHNKLWSWSYFPDLHGQSLFCGHSFEEPDHLPSASCMNPDRNFNENYSILKTNSDLNL